MKRSSTKGALFTSFIALLLCCVMLLGTTFAWFTDEVTSANNKIQAGTLDIRLFHSTTKDDWKEITESKEPVFTYDNWEPGYADVHFFEVLNEGTLALKWKASFKAPSEVGAIAEVIDVYVKEYADKADVDSVRTTIGRDNVKADWTKVSTLDKFIANLESATTGILESKKSEALGIALVMQETADNKYQGGKIDNFDITVFATQLNYEKDSFDENYDINAPKLTIEVTPANIQEYLDGKHGTLEDVTLKLTAGNYGVLNIGRPTKYAGNNSEYYCGTHDFTTNDAEAFKAHLGDTVSLLATEYHTTPKYTTTLKNFTIEGTDGATVEGVLATTGHSYGDVYDYVRDIDYDSGSAYYSTLSMKNVTFKNVAFTGKVDINTSDADTVIDGVAFDGCTFTTGGTAAANGAAIRYYNEANNGKVRNITVKDSTFTNCYQGVYVHNSNGVTVIGNTFDTTGHNAIALQSGPAGAVDLKNVVIKNNVFNNIGDRVIRMGDVGADTSITMENNVATNSGDEDGEVIKATTIAEGITVNASKNKWGGIVVNEILRDAKVQVSTPEQFKEAITAGGPVVLNEDIVIDEALEVKEDTTIDLNSKTLSGDADTKTLLKITDGTVSITNGTIKNVVDNATETQYSIYMSGDAKAEIKNVDIVTSGTGIYLADDAVITELNANVDSYMNANGYCCYDGITLVGNARIEEITGGTYSAKYSDEYIDSWNQTHSYSGIVSYPINVNSENASIGTISGGTFLGVMDKAFNGTPIHVNSGKIELISGGYFGFSKSLGLTAPEKLIFVNSSNNGSIDKITGGTFEKGSWDTGFGCDFASIVDNSGCQVVETGETVDVQVQFSTKVSTYTLNVLKVTAK